MRGNRKRRLFIFLILAYYVAMSEQQRFDDLMKRTIKVSPEELRRRLEAKKTVKEITKKHDQPS